MLKIKDTKHQLVQLVFPEHTNFHGTLHGGILMNWILLAGSITSSRIAGGMTVLGASDSIDFINPVMVGEIVILDCWVEHIGKSSLEIIVHVHSENVQTKEQKLITIADLAFVAIDEDAKPRDIHEKLDMSTKKDSNIILKAEQRKKERIPKIKKRREQVLNAVDETEKTRFNLKTTRLVLPEDAFYGNFMSVGKLLKYIDESASILAKRYTKGVLVTGSLDDLYFYAPIHVGEVIEFKAGITYVGNTTLDIAIKVDSQNLTTGRFSHICTAFLAFVNIGEDGRPTAVPEFKAETPYEIRMWKGAEKRRKIRSKRLKKSKKLAKKH